jgi:hypothetical protein
MNHEREDPHRQSSGNFEPYSKYKTNQSQDLTPSRHSKYTMPSSSHMGSDSPSRYREDFNSTNYGRSPYRQIPKLDNLYQPSSKNYAEPSHRPSERGRDTRYSDYRKPEPRRAQSEYGRPKPHQQRPQTTQGYQASTPTRPYNANHYNSYSSHNYKNAGSHVADNVRDKYKRAYDDRRAGGGYEPQAYSRPSYNTNPTAPPASQPPASIRPSTPKNQGTSVANPNESAEKPQVQTPKKKESDSQPAKGAFNMVVSPEIASGSKGWSFVPSPQTNKKEADKDKSKMMEGIQKGPLRL